MADTSIGGFNTVTDSRGQPLRVRAAPQIADLCAVDALTEDGRLERMAAAHVDPRKESLIVELHRRSSPAVDDTHGVAGVLRSGRPERYPDTANAAVTRPPPTEAQQELLDVLGNSSAMIVPVPARGRTMGAITFALVPSAAWTN